MLQHNKLANAFEFEILKQSEDDWPYDWSSTKCGTPFPTPRDNYATLWMTCNHSDSVFQDLCQFFEMAKKKLKAKIERKPNNRNEVVIKDAATSQILLRGIMYSGAQLEANVGRYAIFQAKTEKGCELVVKIASFSNWGYTTYLFHDQVSRQVDDNKIIKVTSGLDSNVDSDNIMSMGLSTRLDLYVDNTIAARCHISYRDLSRDPSIGPTVEMIATHKSFQGKGLLDILWFWVKMFVEDNLILESLNVEAPERHVMIKATKLRNVVIEINEDGTPVTDKDFFYNHAGFSVRKQMDMLTTFTTASQQEPMDGEAVLYIPLLSKEQVKKRAEARFAGDEVDTYSAGFPRKKGARSCRACQRIKMGLLRCTRCGHAYYCNVACQRKDFKDHKQWCGKAYQELHETLVQVGRRKQAKDGSWFTILS